MSSMSPPPGAAITIASLPNLRDLGGYATADGATVRTGVLFRSVALSELSDADLASFDLLGIRTVFDLRTEQERSARPDRPIDGVSQVALDVLADSTDSAPAQLEALLGDPVHATEQLGEGQAQRLFEQGYREFVSLPSACAAYGGFFTALLEDTTMPALFHCTTGKDRTGWAAATTLMLLGVARSDVVADYLATNRDLLAAWRPLFEQFRDAGGDPAVLEPVLGVEAEYLEAALDEMDTAFGSLTGYFRDGLGLDAAAQDELRARLLM